MMHLKDLLLLHGTNWRVMIFILTFFYFVGVFFKKNYVFFVCLFILFTFIGIFCLFICLFLFVK